MNRNRNRIIGWILTIGIIGWLLAVTFVTAYYFSDTNEGRPWYTIVLDWIYRLLQVMLISGVIGFFIRKFIESIIDPEEDVLGKHFIEKIYANRHEANQDLIEDVNNLANNEIDIIGISLRDFLSGQGILSGVWSQIIKRLEDPNDNLKVRILLLHPKSLVGYIRFEVEDTKFNRSDLKSDMPQSVRELETAYKSLNDTTRLQARFYHDSSFAFAFICNNNIYIEQYSYRNHNERTTFPLIKYNSVSTAYKQFKRSFGIQWDNSKQTSLLNYEDVGIYPATIKASIKNIYPGDRASRKLLGEKQISVIENTKSGTIRILAFTGKFYMQRSNYYVIREFTIKPDCKIKFLLIDPVSEQAILRSVADNSKAEDILTNLNKWNWRSHTSSSLYQDSMYIRERINSFITEKHNVQLRYTNAPITSALFLSEDKVFIEQYLFGKSSKSKDVVLGGEYPVFEFDFSDAKSETPEEKNILKSSFEVLWSNYSKDYKRYDSSLEESTFERNLNQLKEYFEKEINSANTAPPSTG